MFKKIYKKKEVKKENLKIKYEEQGLSKEKRQTRFKQQRYIIFAFTNWVLRANEHTVIVIIHVTHLEQS